MNILFLCSAQSWGGNEKWALAAASGLADRGHRVWFGCRWSEFARRAEGAPITFVDYPLAGNYDLQTLMRIRRDLRNFEIDALIPTKQREYFLGGLAATGRPKTKVVARLGIDRPIKGWRNRLAFGRLFDGLIVNAQTIVDVLARSPGFDPRICRVVHNGIPLPKLEPEHRSRIRVELGLNEADFVIAGVGRLSPQKGFDLAIAALAQLAPEAPTARLLLVGDGSSQSDLLDQANRLGIAERVVFTGFREDVPAILQAVDLFWLTSRSEGMANVLLEAMANGRTACAFAISGVAELVENGVHGLTVPPGDVEALVRATREMLFHPDRRRSMETAARSRVATDFSPDAMVDGVEIFLREVAANGS